MAKREQPSRHPVDRTEAVHPGERGLPQELATPTLVVVALLAVVAGAGAAWLAGTSELAASPIAEAVLAVVVGCSFVASGLVAWRHRPSNPLGAVMIGIGFAWFATFLEHARDPLVFTIGTSLEVVYLAGFVYLVLSFPSGQLSGAVDRALVAAAVFLAVVVELAWLLFADSRAVICDDCPENAFQIVRNDALAEGLLTGQRMAGAVLSVVTVALLAERWRRATSPQRHAVAPVLWVGSAMFVALGITIANDLAGEPLGPAADWIAACVFAAVPVAVLLVLLQQRLARGAVAGLVVELGEGPKLVGLRDSLARALGDPSLELAYWLPASSRYVDGEGAPVQLPKPGSSRVATVVERAGEPIAALVHDPALSENAELIDSVCAAAALALENERLQAELRSRLDELRRSRARIVEAAEVERRRIERDLHDGTQRRLVSIAMTLGLAESKLEHEPAAVGPILREAKAGLQLALEEVRELSQGILPSTLVERGLPAALEELARSGTLPVRLAVRVDRRLPEHVEAAAYFVVSEALANADKHSHGRECSVTASDDGRSLVIEIADDGIGGAGAGTGSASGSGLRGLADRVEALGGRFTVSSPPGRGTVVRAEIPCA